MDCFEHRKRKTKDSIRAFLFEHYLNDSVWKSMSADTLSHITFFNNACFDYLQGRLVFGFEASELFDRYLSLGVPDKGLHELRDAHNPRPFQFSHLMVYHLNLAVFPWFEGEPCSVHALEDSSECHLKHLNQYGYALDDELEPEDPDTRLATIVPKLIIDKHLGLSSRDSQMALIGTDIEGSIWQRALDVIVALNERTRVVQSWRQFLKEWKRCFAEANFHGFGGPHIVLLFDLVCRFEGKDGGIEELADEILQNS